MVAYLEKTDGNAEFHKIIYFLTRNSIHYALTVSPVVSTMFVEQFSMTSKSKTINNVRYITATVVGKPVSISEASIRSDLHFNDAVGIDGKILSRNVTPLFPSMLAQPTKDECVVSERPSETQPTPSFSHPSEDPIKPQPDPSLRPSSSNPIPDSIPEGFGGNHGGQSSSDRSLSGNEDGLTLQSVYDLCVSLCKQVITQATQIKDLKSQIKQLKKKPKPVISHHHAWIKSVSMKKSLTKKLMQKESVSKHGRKPAKFKPTVHKDPAFDDIVDDAMDYIETEDAQDEGRTSSKTLELSLFGDTVVLEEKESEEKGVSTEDLPKVSTDKDDEGIVEPKDGNSDESATPTMSSTPTLIVFGDDETIAQVLITMSQNKPLPKIDPKAKGKKKIEEEDESDTESEDITEAKKNFKMLANDEEIARNIQEE
ncbi:hypothetical protein Tco_0072602 [Tanacetum coccineum]